MNLDELRVDVEVYLRILGVPKWEHLVIGDKIAYVFLVDLFSTIICVVDEKDIGFVATRVNDLYGGYRLVYVTKESSINDQKEAILWEFMRGGYMRWLRYTHPRKFNHAIMEQRFGDKILRKRVSLYGDKKRYKFWKEDDTEALKLSPSYMLSSEPGFYDYMPEEDLI